MAHALGHRLRDKTLTDEPLTDETLTDEPLTDEPLTDEPLTDETLTDETLRDEPQTSQAPSRIRSRSGISFSSRQAWMRSGRRARKT